MKAPTDGYYWVKLGKDWEIGHLKTIASKKRYVGFCGSTFLYPLDVIGEWGNKIEHKEKGK